MSSTPATCSEHLTHDVVVCLAVLPKPEQLNLLGINKGLALYSIVIDTVTESAHQNEFVITDWVEQTLPVAVITQNFFGDSIRRTDEVEERAIVYALERASERYDGSFDWIEW